MKFWRKPTPTADLIARAEAELATNPTIHAYRWPPITLPIEVVERAVNNTLDRLWHLLGIDPSGIGDALDEITASLRVHLPATPIDEQDAP